MPKPKAPAKPTINELRAAGKIPADDIDKLERLAIRMIQIQAERNALEAEKGFNDQDGYRRRGIEDELQELYIVYGLPGIRMEDFYVLPYDGSRSHIDPILLANAGVDGETIKKSTVTSYWAGVKVQKKTRSKKQ